MQNEPTARTTELAKVHRAVTTNKVFLWFLGIDLVLKGLTVILGFMGNVVLVLIFPLTEPLDVAVFITAIVVHVANRQQRVSVAASWTVYLAEAVFLVQSFSVHWGSAGRWLHTNGTYISALFTLVAFVLAIMAYRDVQAKLRAVTAGA